MKNRKLSDENIQPRRNFMIRSLEVLAGLGLLPMAGKRIFAAEKAPASRVCLVKSAKPLKPEDDVREIIGEMMDRAISYVSGNDDPAKFWKATFSPEDRVSVKISTVIDKPINFGPQITDVMANRLTTAGVKAENIVFWDRETKYLKKSGYPTNVDGPGVRYYGTNEVGMSDTERVSGKVTAKFSNILEDCTALINMPILKTHDLAGVSMALKNHYGSFDRPQMYHANACDPFIADLNLAEPIKTKHRLVICDAMRVLYASGPQFNPQYTTEFNGLLVAVDPVALDAAGTMILRRLRKESGKKPLPYYTKPIHIETAGEKGLGEADFKKIDFKSITV